jgi:hypothetical protein
MLVNNSKKRPNNCIIGRNFDNHLLDIIELEIKNYKSLKELNKGLDLLPGSRPVVLF